MENRFNVTHILMETFIENSNLKNISSEKYIIDFFNDNFMYGELYDIFSKKVKSKIQLKYILNTVLGHDFIDLDMLTETERDYYY